MHGSSEKNKKKCSDSCPLAKLLTLNQKLDSLIRNLFCPPDKWDSGEHFGIWTSKYVKHLLAQK